MYVIFCYVQLGLCVFITVSSSVPCVISYSWYHLEEVFFFFFKENVMESIYVFSLLIGSLSESCCVVSSDWTGSRQQVKKKTYSVSLRFQFETDPIYFIPFAVSSSAKTHLVLVELGHAQVPLLLSQLRAAICCLIRVLCFVCNGAQTHSARRLHEGTRLTAGWDFLLPAASTYRCRSWQCTPSCRMRTRSCCTPPGSRLRPRRSRPPGRILQGGSHWKKASA